MSDQAVTLHNLIEQAEWRCAWEAVADYRQHHPEAYGRDQGATYTFEGEALGEMITIGVWRSKHGLNAARVDKENEPAKG